MTWAIELAARGSSGGLDGDRSGRERAGADEAGPSQMVEVKVRAAVVAVDVVAVVAAVEAVVVAVDVAAVGTAVVAADNAVAVVVLEAVTARRARLGLALYGVALAL